MHSHIPVPPSERLAALTAATGLTLLDGPPTAHFRDAYAFRRIEARGAPHGRPVTLYADRDDMVFQAGLSVATEAQVYFEIRTRRLPVRPFFERSYDPPLVLPLSSFGDASLDARLELRAREPWIGPLLAPWARVVAESWLHIVATPGELAVQADEQSLSVLTGSELLLLVLEEMARALEGRPALSEVDADAPARVRALRCARCGGEARVRPATVHQPVAAQCSHCQAEVPIAPEMARAIRALRARSMVERHAHAVASVVDVSRDAGKAAGAMAGVFVVLAGCGVLAMMGVQVVRVLWSGAPPSVVIPAALAMMCATLVGLGLVIAAFWARTRLWRTLPSATAAAPSALPTQLTCASCGAPTIMRGAITRCAHCGAENVGDRERLRIEAERAAREGRAIHADAARSMDRLWDQPPG